MKNMKPLILISNDDGYHAKGINQLIEMVADMGEVIVCAPESARSGYATAFSATEPLRLKPRKPRAGVQVWSCNGTPVDCVKLALSELCPRKPDLVIGGINHGDNASVNSHYSGTMGVCLHVNFPVVVECKGVKVCRMAHGTWSNEVERMMHPRGYEYYWMVGQYTNDEPQACDTDNWALQHGYVAITPTTIDVTAHEAMDEMTRRFEQA